MGKVLSLRVVYGLLGLFPRVAPHCTPKKCIVSSSSVCILISSAVPKITTEFTEAINQT